MQCTANGIETDLIFQSEQNQRKEQLSESPLNTVLKIKGILRLKSDCLTLEQIFYTGKNPKH